MAEIRRDNSKRNKLFIAIGIVLLVVVGLFIWQSVDRYKEVQQIESKLGFEITVVDRQSHEAWWAATRTYLVKPVDDESNLEYMLYLNKENKIEQWAKVENGEVQNIKYEDM
ncbi:MULTISPECIES: hypothetical protein [Bacillaceae]|uniref:hypothetical protein n=1 Tax=Bacillaceae TaxID=186817 RepID=UPI001E456D7C|nr:MULTISPECIES: hypothetical protein [Bacillaceae]MCE4051534.1 hypothetical protein [Bacillus sp. Au-Bac7]MCM3031687.1 hypothetical protein [Niallia sp. MER 6]UPO89794.1 hypothetical protein L8T27_023635 [Niallia sp. Man26]